MGILEPEGLARPAYSKGSINNCHRGRATSEVSPRAQSIDQDVL